VPFWVVEDVEAVAHGENTQKDGGIMWKLYGHEDQTAVSFPFSTVATIASTSTTNTALTSTTVLDNLKNATAFIIGVVRYSRDLTAATTGVPTVGSITNNPCPQRFAELPFTTYVINEGSRKFTEEISFSYQSRFIVPKHFKCASPNFVLYPFAAHPWREEHCSGHLTPSSMNNPKLAITCQIRPNGSITAGGSLGAFPASGTPRTRLHIRVSAPPPLCAQHAFSNGACKSSYAATLVLFVCRCLFPFAFCADPWARAYGNAAGANPNSGGNEYTLADTHMDKRVDIFGVFNQLYRKPRAARSFVCILTHSRAQSTRRPSSSPGSRKPSALDHWFCKRQCVNLSQRASRSSRTMTSPGSN